MDYIRQSLKDDYNIPLKKFVTITAYLKMMF